MDADDTDLSMITQDEIKELQYYIEKNGVKGIDVILKQKVHAWKFVDVNIGILGECMTGKSTFINRIRGLSDTDVDAAKVGLGDITRAPTQYIHPHNNCLKLWDLPGVGTTRFPKNEHYLKCISFDRYDFFLIFSDGSFSENDSWLAQQIVKNGKQFFFVRTKVDNDMENVETDEGVSHQDEVLCRIHTECERNFKMTGLRNVKLFIISNFEIFKWDFESLLDMILLSLPRIKRNMMVLSLGPISKTIIKQKKEALQQRAWYISVISAIAGGIPFPGLDIAVDIGLFCEELNHMLQTFGLDEDSLKHLADKTGNTLDYYINTLKHAGPMILSTRQHVQRMLLNYVKEKAVETSAQKLSKYLPVVGQVISGGISYATTVYLLISTINNLEQDANRVLQDVLSHAASTAM